MKHAYETLPAFGERQSCCARCTALQTKKYRINNAESGNGRAVRK